VAIASDGAALVIAFSRVKRLLDSFAYRRHLMMLGGRLSVIGVPSKLLPGWISQLFAQAREFQPDQKHSASVLPCRQERRGNQKKDKKRHDYCSEA
jgi:hypothetical protein